MNDDETRRADRAAWRHAQDTGRFSFLSRNDIERLVINLFHTAEEVDLRTLESVTTEEVESLIEWADKARASDALLQNVLSGSAYVRMKGREPHFELTSRGLAEGMELAEQMGLPTDGLL